LKVRCASVDKPPLLITQDKEMGAPMHSAQGAGNSFFNLIWKETTKINSYGNNLQEQIQEIHKDIILFIKNFDKLMKKQQQAFKARVTVLRNVIHKGTENGEDVSSKEKRIFERT
jgi:predicted RNase H-like nuclease